VRLHGRIPLDAVAGALATADVIVSPIRRNRFSEISLSTKVYEGAIMGKPVVAADLPAARAEFDADMLAWYAPDDPEDLARAILRVVDDAVWRDAASTQASVRARELSWDVEAPRYLGLVEELAGDRVSS
jgi:glycosyltransferase involved in cell wall biosynthesis